MRWSASVLVLFCKQKTAYEMRISDWSSDVCSSDLPVTAGALTAAVLFIAERIETLLGIWGIGLAPTGERDPYGLRRAALGLISAFEPLQAGGYLNISDTTTLTLHDLPHHAADTFELGVIAAGTEEARPAGRRVGEECVRTCRPRWAASL